VIGLSLALGLLTRAGAVFAMIRATVNILVAGGMGMDTVGFNAMLFVAALIVVVTGAGRFYGLDRSLRQTWPGSRFLQLLT
jgi:uncharacterized membrane protein YphA (DoxX/SURF4 family)